MALDLAVWEHRLIEAVEEHDEPTAESLCGELRSHLADTDTAISVASAGRILTTLRRRRYYGLLADVADAMLQSGQQAPVVAFRYAQALIDQGLTAAAEAILRGAEAQARRDPASLAELEGMLGRAYKQMYVAAGPGAARRAEFMQKALGAYARGSETGPGTHRWQAINLVALQARAIRDGLAAAGANQFPARAAGLVAEVEAAYADPESAITPWDCAVAAEACVAIARNEEAVAWLERYAADPRVDSFQLASTLRQLEEIWQLTATAEPGRSLIPLLQARILDRRQGSAIDIAHSDLPALTSGPDSGPGSGFERILGHDGIVTYRWYRNGLARSRAVAHIGDSSGRPVGTGFLVLGTDLHPALGSDPVLLTNAHVVGENDSVAGALTGDEAVVTFQAHAEEEAEAPSDLRVGSVAWVSPPETLDTAILRLRCRPPDSDVCPLTDALPRLDGKQRVYVIGHPQGRSLAFSIADNLLLDHDERFVHYRAPTEPGSSGSPVFNRNWEVIGLHHAGRPDMPRLHGSGTYPANEGIWIGAIREALASDPPA